MHYSKEEIISLIEHLKSYGEDGLMYYPIFGVFEDIVESLNEEGLSIPGNMASAQITNTLEFLFPDVLFALKMPPEDLPLYISKENCLEYPIAVWRLKLQR